MQKMRRVLAKLTIAIVVLGAVAAGRPGSALGDFPVKVSSNGRYLEDRDGKPYLLHGDSAWSLIVQLTKQETEIYLEQRRQQGFNSIVVNLLEYYFATDPPKNAYGVGPFATPGDFSTPVEEYFAHVDWVLTKAAEKGFLVQLNPCYLGGTYDGWWREVEANGAAKCREFGNFLGKRYKHLTNIIWVAGGDQTPTAGSPREKNWLEIFHGIKEYAPAHLWTAHWENKIDSLDVPAFQPYLDLNGVYAYPVQDQRLLRAYNRADIKPIFLWESWYEGRNWSGKITPPEVVRRQAYWALLCGATGHNFGSNHVWSFGARTHSKYSEPDVDWRAGIEKRGSREMVHLKALFAGRDWHRLAPDQNHAVVTAGYGTLGKSDYVAAASTVDGRLVLAYVPSTGAAPRTLTLNMEKLSGKMTGKWFNPTSGDFTTIAGSPFANSMSQDFVTKGDNGSGANDWVLVLETENSPAAQVNGKPPLPPAQ